MKYKLFTVLALATTAFAQQYVIPIWSCDQGPCRYVFATAPEVMSVRVDPPDPTGKPSLSGTILFQIPAPPDISALQAGIAALQSQVSELTARVQQLESQTLPPPPTLASSPVALQGGGVQLRLGANCTSGGPCTVAQWGRILYPMHGCDLKLPDTQTAEGEVLVTLDTDGFRIHDMRQTLPLSVTRIGGGTAGCLKQGAYVGPPLPDLNAAGEMPLFYTQVRNGRFAMERWLWAGPNYWLRVAAP